MGFMACKLCRGAAVIEIAVLLMLVGGVTGNMEVDPMICYKPPPPANTSTTNHKLLNFDPKIDQEIAPIVLSQVSAVSLTGNCGVEYFLSYVIPLYVFHDSTVSCSYQNKFKPILTPLPSASVNVMHIYPSGVRCSQCSVTLTFDYIAASDGQLLLNCLLELPVPIDGGGSILKDTLVTASLTFKIQGCPHGRHGVLCDELCSCAAGVECHPFTGQCVCPRGLQGETCSSAQPMLFLEGPSTVFVPFGDSVTLTCTSYGMLPSLWWWSRDQIKYDSINRTEDVAYNPKPFIFSTTIVAIDADVNGVYSCNIVNNNTLYSRNVTVIVSDIPNPFLEAPGNQTVVLGSSVELRCRTKPEAGTLTWMKGNQTISRAALDGQRNQTMVLRERNQTVSLVIEEVEFEDAGNYRCLVGHPGANDSAVAGAWLTVASQGSPPSMYLQGTQNLLSPPQRQVLEMWEGETQYLKCGVQEAYPKPQISWIIGEDNCTEHSTTFSRLSPNGVSYDVNGSLTFRPTWQDDGKRLACVSTVPNFQPIRSGDILLNVSYVPKVSVTPLEKTFQPGDSPHFACDAQANPPSTVYQWTLRQKNGKIVRKYRGRSVQIHNIKPSHNMASLTCFVMNAAGTNNSKAIIKVFDDSKDGSKFLFAVMIAVLGLLAVLTFVTPFLVYKHRSKIQDLFFKNKRDQEIEGKTHDVFIAYKGGGEEEEFVVNRLEPKLLEWGCNVCIHYQSFLPGREIADNIEVAVASCRKTILVLSPGFMASEWCYFEFMCAVEEMMRNQTNHIIPLMFRDIRGEGLCQSMQNLLDSVSFIPWTEGTGCGPAGLGQTNEFWQLLKRAVETEFNVAHTKDEEEGNDVGPDTDNDLHNLVVL